MKSKKQSIMKRKMYKFKNQFISKSVHLLIMMLISSSIFAQVPNTMSYQAVVRDENGQLVKSQSVGIRISILQGSMDGTEIFQEIYIPSLKTNANGLLSMEIGTGTALVGEFSDIDWTAGPYFIKTETDPKGGTNYTLTGTNQLLSVPYAMHAKTAEIAEIAKTAETATGSILARIEALENFEPILLANGFTDSRDGNHYNAVKIGNQVWMAENLKYLPSVVGPDTGSTTVPYYYVYNYNGTNVDSAIATSNYATYGVLYNWAAAMDGAASSRANPSGVQGVCPAGWHLPSDAEWTALENYLIAYRYNYDGTTTENKIAKAMAATTGWNSSSTRGAVGNTDYPAYQNKSGFTALPGGSRNSNGTFDRVGYNGYWWNATEAGAPSAWDRSMSHDRSSLGKYGYVSKENGFSVRCVKD